MLCDFDDDVQHFLWGWLRNSHVIKCQRMIDINQGITYIRIKVDLTSSRGVCAWRCCSITIFSCILVCTPLSQLGSFTTTGRALMVHIPIIFYQLSLLADIWTIYAQLSHAFDNIQIEPMAILPGRKSGLLVLKKAFVIQIVGLALGISGLASFMMIENSIILMLVGVFLLKFQVRALMELNQLFSYIYTLYEGAFYLWQLSSLSRHSDYRQSTALPRIESIPIITQARMSVPQPVAIRQGSSSHQQANFLERN